MWNTKIKVMVKRILNKHGYPPDLQEEAVRVRFMAMEFASEAERKAETWDEPQKNRPECLYHASFTSAAA